MMTEEEIDAIGKQIDAAAKNNDAQTLMALYQQAPSILGNAPKAYWILRLAIENGSAQVVEKLITEAHVDPNFLPMPFYEPVIHTAIAKNKPDVLQVLIDNGAKVNVLSNGEDPQSSTPISTAVFYHRTECAKILIDEGADLSPTSCDNRSLYCWAGEIPELELVHAKLQGSSINHQDDKGKTALHFAARDVKLEAIRFLIENGALVTPACHEKGTNALHSFIIASPFGPMGMSGMTAERYLDTLDVLLAQAKKENLSVDCPNKNGTTPLMYVAMHEVDDKTINLAKNAALKLASHGCKVDTPDDKGLTALHYAMETKNYAFAKFLCAEMDADPYLKDNENRCALDYSVDNPEAKKCAEDLSTIFKEKKFAKIAAILTETGTTVRTPKMQKIKILHRNRMA